MTMARLKLWWIALARSTSRGARPHMCAWSGYLPSVVCAPRRVNSTPQTMPYGVCDRMKWPHMGFCCGVWRGSPSSQRRSLVTTMLRVSVATSAAVAPVPECAKRSGASSSTVRPRTPTMVTSSFCASSQSVEAMTSRAPGAQCASRRGGATSSSMLASPGKAGLASRVHVAYGRSSSWTEHSRRRCWSSSGGWAARTSVARGARRALPFESSSSSSSSSPVAARGPSARRVWERARPRVVSSSMRRRRRRERRTGVGRDSHEADPPRRAGSG
mmetsp:Transcript_14482/g.57722  ORF Transcript_14482/g.57722 Transcript_14482/m.57722 type:complete len:273 (-) Transcript_14482:140-958(-)